MKLFIALSMIFIASGYCELLSDPKFKKPESNWHLRKGKEYKNIKETYKKGEFTLNSPAPSSRIYLCLYAEANLTEGEIYKLQVEVKTPGSGAISYGYGTYGDIFAPKGKKRTKKTRSKETKGENLGLLAATDELSTNWKTHTCYFKVKPKKSDLNTYLKVFLGEYMGEFKMRNPSITKVDNLPTSVKLGIIDVQ